jgi:hypothetical protein
VTSPWRAVPVRPVTVLVWALLLTGLWLWGRALTGGPAPTGLLATGGFPAAGGPPPAHDPLSRSVRPARVDIDALGVHARVVPRGLDAYGGVAAPPYRTPGRVGWSRRGTAPGGGGAALLVGHVDTDTRRAVFHRLGRAVPGTRVDVTRADGSVAEFTVEDVEVQSRRGFDARRAYGQRRAGRAELRLITCGGIYDRGTRAYSANVIVSAYLTGTRGR